MFKLLFYIVCFILLTSTISAFHNYEELCPEDCVCYSEGINCSSLGLTKLPDFTISNFTIKWIDLSINFFTEIPDEIFQIEFLEILYMNENPLTSLFGTDFYSSTSLKKLSLGKCKIGKILNQDLTKRLPNIEYLNLESNPIHNFPDLISVNLTYLDLSNTRLGILQPNIFTNMPRLSTIDLSRNHRIALITKTGSVFSNSLKKINLSYCNMDRIELDGFQHLTNVNLRGNMIQQLNRESFKNNKLIENIDLSSNSINNINLDTFRYMKQLKHLDLSFNMITKIERDTFKYNEVLININLSRNYISRFNKFFAKSLTYLNLNACEIISIDPDAFNGIPNINEIDLSNNLLSTITDLLHSDSLQILDLSMCRITSIRNTTFRNFPEISKINLSGNRLTKPFKSDFFEDNKALEELFIGDNLWFCDCEDNTFFEFYSHFMNSYSRIGDRENTKCVNPEELYGLTWEVACFPIWYPDTRVLTTAEKIWTFLMVGVIVFSGSVCIIMSIKRCMEGRKLAMREDERQSYLEEQRNIMRENRMRMEQEASLNAPDPRESVPPCYEDALLLPRLNNTFASLDELSARGKYKQNNNKIDANENLTRRCRCRSEEVILSRDIINERQRSTIRTSNTSINHISEINDIESPSSTVQKTNDVLYVKHKSPYSRRKHNNNIENNETQNENNNNIRNDNEINTIVQNSVNPPDVDEIVACPIESSL